MKAKTGLVFMFLGLLLMCGALCLYLHNGNVSSQAQRTSQAVLPQIMENIPEEPAQEALTERLTPVEFLQPEAFEMTEVTIDGYGYIGYLSIPSLNLELPVMGDWDYDRLQIAPCRYYGSINGEDLVLMAHNYLSHFGNLSKLQLGDSVSFTDMDGIVTNYTVVGRDILHPGAVEEMIAGDFDLTLFTCTYGGENRVTVYCNVS